MKYFDNIKPVLEWIVDIILKLRLRKTYWSIAVPSGLFIIGELVKKLDFAIKLTNYFYSQSENFWSSLFWKFATIYFSLKLPWWSLLLLVLVIIFFTYVYLQELKAKRSGCQISAESIINSVQQSLSQKVKDEISEIKEELSFMPNDNWFDTQCKSSINDLGGRYTPELNFELEVAEIFDGLGRTTEFQKRIDKRIDNLIIKGKKVLKENPSIPESLLQLQQNFDSLFELHSITSFQGTEILPQNKMHDLLTDSLSVSQVLYDYYHDEERKIQKEKNDYHFYHKYGLKLRNLRELIAELNSIINYLKSDSFRLANCPYLILDGEAGIGKSHLLGDIVSKRITKGYKSIFLLGQHFVTDEDPWTQIFKKLQIKNTPNNVFLKRLNDYGQKQGKRIVIFIDAINEGRGRYFWQNNINSFINDIKPYVWLSLALTIRTSYKNLIYPKNQSRNNEVIECPIFGFRNVEYDASKLFFSNYKIELPNVPLLHPEFQNPLFLKMFCEGISKSGLTKIPDGLQGMSSIINFFIEGINYILSKPNRVDYPESINLVKKSITVLIKHKIELQSRYIPYEKAFELIQKVISPFTDRKGFIEDLITEGVLSKNLFWKSDDEYEEGIYLAYERFEDHLTSLFLIEEIQDITNEFKEGGKLFDIVKDERAINFNKGIIDALSVQLPEKFGKELFELTSHIKGTYSIIESFVDSLLWRKVESFTEISRTYVNEYVLKYNGTYELFWENIISVAGIPGHFFNAYSLHENLMKYSLPDRDSHWTQLLKYKFHDDSSVKRLIDWSWLDNDKTHISDEAIKLASITLMWFHTSTNRKLRDCSTKAMINLLKDRINVLIELLELFENVNDPFVYERLYAVAYGCSVHNRDKQDLYLLSNSVFEKIFNVDEVYPHILLRDYARGVIEYSNHIGCDFDFDIAKVRPPYKSTWPDNIPSEKELEEKYDNEKYCHIWSSVMSFGDFARYTIGTNHNYSEWSGFQKGETPIDREEVLNDFKEDLSEEQLLLFESLDPIISEESGEELKIGDTAIKFDVAVGRKTEEELADIRLKFKNSLSQKALENYESEIEPYLDHNHNIINTAENFDLRIAQRLIFNRVIELGWNPKQHLTFDKDIGTGRVRSTQPHERIGKKYQWIAYYEYLAKLSDNFIKHERSYSRKNIEQPYQGPWEPYVRDIDPTILIRETGNYDENNPESFWWTNGKSFNWDCTNEEWLTDGEELPEFEELIQIKDLDGNSWIVLEGYPSWSEPKKIGEEKWDYPHKEIWCHVRSYLVKEGDFDTFATWAVKQDFMGRWMPESTDRYEMFSREYYWSPAYKFFGTEYYGGNVWSDVNDRDSGEFIASVAVSAESYLWEEEFDRSKEEVLSFLKPCSLIYDGMDLNYSCKEGEFVDSSNNLICFASNVLHNSKSYLLIRKEPFLKFLKENKLKIIWTILGEKQVLGGRSFKNDYKGRLEYSGAYILEDDKLEGRVNIKKKKF